MRSHGGTLRQIDPARDKSNHNGNGNKIIKRAQTQSYDVARARKREPVLKNRIVLHADAHCISNNNRLQYYGYHYETDYGGKSSQRFPTHKQILLRSLSRHDLHQTFHARIFHDVASIMNQLVKKRDYDYHPNDDSYY
jgi:hypothetical protein